jgi:hypothetical protein
MRGLYPRRQTPHPSAMLRIASTLSHRGRGQTAQRLHHGVMEIGEKSTNQLFGCTKPLTLGLMARGETSWAT